tara:strand:- start:208 stop:672 length:465 start_codon:yes stop_codon:yes gene_type:complete
MIIICPCGEKKFEIEENLIPKKGRLLQCGSCDEKWFFKPGKKIDYLDDDKTKSIESKPNDIGINDYNNTKKDASNENIKIENKSKRNIKKLSFGFYLRNFFSYLIVFFISIVALIILLDTLKQPLIFLLPNLEFYLFNLFEVLKDINLFIMDLL